MFTRLFLCFSLVFSIPFLELLVGWKSERDDSQGARISHDFRRVGLRVQVASSAVCPELILYSEQVVALWSSERLYRDFSMRAGGRLAIAVDFRSRAVWYWCSVLLV
ncbi:Alpha/beta-Hydrolases superfamily protein isoform 1 [Dorcoceras hygrometricum]|uniref:Alpha/beta-Hydrolases superfamily protein isoform 1 n=1 Tax=Dorcoceras hygrometricum TaxID=472368 RepID=A0A2Z7DG75_9LAMI|nr:Alpha/beta-Hydrolases superfamily protein isoform 1 [Dorcoceras hygrometricum]